METSRDVAGEVREIDVWFTPAPRSPGDTLGLGLLGRLAEEPAIIEPFRNAVTKSQIRSCISKLFDVQADERTSGETGEDKRSRGCVAFVMDSFSHSISAIVEWI